MGRHEDPLAEGTEAKVTVEPTNKFDMGMGPGKPFEGKAMGGKAALS